MSFFVWIFIRSKTDITLSTWQDNAGRAMGAPDSVITLFFLIRAQVHFYGSRINDRMTAQWRDCAVVQFGVCFVVARTGLLCWNRD